MPFDCLLPTSWSCANVDNFQNSMSNGSRTSRISMAQRVNTARENGLKKIPATSDTRNKYNHLHSEAKGQKAEF